VASDGINGYAGDTMMDGAWFIAEVENVAD
jgi:hypothetical protein